MEDRRLDSFLEEAKKQSNRFFAGWNPQLHPQQVEARYCKRKPHRYLSWLSQKKLGVVLAGILILSLVSVNLIDTSAPLLPAGAGVPFYGGNQIRYAGYEDPIINMLLAEDFVVRGSLVFRNGILVEETAGGLVTRIMPYQMNPYGELVLATEQVLLQVGEELLLVGVNLPYYVELNAGDHYIQKVNERGTGYLSETRFSVLHPGEDRLQLIPRSDPAKMRTIYVKVIQ